MRELRDLISTRRYDVVHTHLSKAGIVGRLAARGHARRVFHTVHMASFGPGYHRAASAMYLLAERACAPMADVTVFVGTDLLQAYVAAGVTRPDRAMVIRSPIELDSFLATRQWDGARRRMARSALGLQPEGPVLLTIGTLEPRKRQGLLIRRLATWLTQHDGQLAIAGDGPLRGDLERTAHAQGVGSRVRVLGHVTEIPEAIAASTALVHASAAEGVPQVVLQALAAGLPVIATDVTGLREVGDASVAVVDRSARGFADAVTDALRSKTIAPATEAFREWTCERIDDRLRLLHVGSVR